MKQHLCSVLIIVSALWPLHQTAQAELKGYPMAALQRTTDTTTAARAPTSTTARPKWSNPRLQSALDRVRSLSTLDRPLLPPTTRPAADITAVSTTGYPVSGLYVMVDAGHGDYDTGATWGHVREKDINLSAAKIFTEVLTSEGAIVEMMRKDDTFVPLNTRVARTNQSKPRKRFFMSFHTNDAPHSPSGIEVYFYTAQSEALACWAYNALVTKLGVTGRFVMQKGYRVVKFAEMPAILVEMGYIGNAVDRAHLTDSKYLRELAHALAYGVNQYVAGAPAPSCPIIRGGDRPHPVRHKPRPGKGHKQHV